MDTKTIIRTINGSATEDVKKKKGGRKQQIFGRGNRNKKIMV